MTPADQRVRDLVLEAGQSFHLESPAGSGKTSLLAARYLLLLALGAAPEEVLALTFTRKAAGELRQRILGAMAEARRGGAGEGEAARLLVRLAAQAVRRQGREQGPLLPERLQVMTFHGLCAALAARWPLEAGLSPGTAIMDETEQAPLVEEALARLRLDLFGRPADDPGRQALERRLLRLDNRWDRLARELTLIVLSRDVFGDLLGNLGSQEYTQEQTLEQTLEGRLIELVELRLKRARELLAGSDLGQSWGAFTSELRAQGCLLADLPDPLPEAGAACAPLWGRLCGALLTASGSGRRKFGPATGYYSGFAKTAFAGMIKDLPPECCAALAQCAGLPAAGEALDVAALADLVTVAGEAVGAFERLCRERGVIDFAGVEQAALKALGGGGTGLVTEGLLATDARLGHLLIDEFQDTSRNQWELTRLLCSGFTPGDGRTLFVVGDPKQSIYGFRKAEVALFELARAGFDTEGGRLALTPLALSANFRSRPNLVAWTNRVFEQVMADPFREADEVPFAASEAARQEIARQEVAQQAAGGTVELALFTGTGEDARLREARWLAVRVQEEEQRLGPKEKLAVLLFARTHLAAYVRAIREAGVAVSVREGQPLADTPEVAGLLALTRALVRPHDDLAWAALLRSPWVGADTAALCAVAARGKAQDGKAKNMEGCGWQEMLQGFPDERLSAVHEAVARAQERLLARLPLAEVVKRVWAELDGPRQCAARLGEAALANCRAALDLLARCESPGVPEETLCAFEERLPEAYQPPLDDRPESAVQMLTVHRAKGLEFDVVLLPALDWDPLAGNRREPPYLLERLPSGGHAVALPPDRRGAEGDAAWALVRRFSHDRKLGEAKRLFYTAATRARRALVLSGVTSLKEGAVSPGRVGPLRWLLASEGLLGAEAASLDGQVIGGMGPGAMTVSLDPVPRPRAAAAAAAAPLPERPQLTPEPLLYRKLSASELEGEAVHERAGAAPFEPSLEARLRGTLIHRLLERGAWGALPGAASVAAALVSEGLSPGRAGVLAAEALSEVEGCLAEPWLARALASPERHTELALEALAEGEPGPGRRLDVGVIDLVFRDGDIWQVVDYKTTRPGAGEGSESGIELFWAAQCDKYRPQLNSYRALIARWQGVPEERVRATLYFTALQQRVEG